jgi:Cellulose binding domain
VPAATCSVVYQLFDQWTDHFQVNLTIKNLTASTIDGWTVSWQFPTGQTVAQLWNGTATQSGTTLNIRNPSWNSLIPAGGAVTDVGFTGNWDNVTNALVANVTLNGKRCART